MAYFLKAEQEREREKYLEAEVTRLEAELAAVKAAKERTIDQVEALTLSLEFANNELADYKTELELANARLRLDPLPNDNMIHDESEIRRLYAIAKNMYALRARCEREETSVNELSLANQDLHQELDALRAALAAAKERERVLVDAIQFISAFTRNALAAVKEG